MDESWRMRMGMPMPALHVPTYPPRRSAAEDTPHRRRKSVPDESMALDPEQDFSDVFGGPPRTVLSRQFSARGFLAPSASPSFFYEEIFRPLEKAAPAVTKSGRSLPQFRIPGEQRTRRNHDQEIDGFYSDIFGWEDEQRPVARSRSRSKASSSSVLSSEDLSPLRPAVYAEDGDDVSFFASKLRPINVKSSRASRRMGHEQHSNQQNLQQEFATTKQPVQKSESDYLDNLKSSYFGLNRRNASPETISVEPISNGSYGVSADYSEANSPSSAVSLVGLSGQEQKTDNEIKEQILRPDGDEQEEDEAMSSYVIEINSDNREGTCESNGVDEAIAWAKEKFQTHCPVQECEKEKPSQDIYKGSQLSERHTDSPESFDEHQQKCAEDERTHQLDSMTEIQILDEKMRLWSTGKEGDIRLLLTSLHHILWPNSGWLAIPLANIIEISKVKKAYQKARLCLHPDKLQQRGATLPQKYIAERVFSILQDAWSSFISQDVFCRQEISDQSTVLLF